MIPISGVIVIVWIAVTLLMSFTAETAALVWAVNIILIVILILYTSIKARYTNRRKTIPSYGRRVHTIKMKNIRLLAKEAGWSNKKTKKQLKKHGRAKIRKKLNKKLIKERR